jgi:hypothetical protein
MAPTLKYRSFVTGAAALLFCAATVHAQQYIEITELVCDEGLAVTANVYLRCNGKCASGEDAVLYGTCKWTCSLGKGFSRNSLLTFFCRTACLLVPP